MFCSVPGLGREGRALPQAQTAGVTLPHPPHFLLGRGGGRGEQRVAAWGGCFRSGLGASSADPGRGLGGGGAAQTCCECGPQPAFCSSWDKGNTGLWFRSYLNGIRLLLVLWSPFLLF